MQTWLLLEKNCKFVYLIHSINSIITWFRVFYVFNKWILESNQGLGNVSPTSTILKLADNNVIFDSPQKPQKKILFETSDPLQHSVSRFKDTGLFLSQFVNIQLQLILWVLLKEICRKLKKNLIRWSFQFLDQILEKTMRCVSLHTKIRRRCKMQVEKQYKGIAG